MDTTKTLVSVLATLSVGLPGSAVSAAPASHDPIAAISAQSPIDPAAVLGDPAAPADGQAGPPLTSTQASLVAWARERFEAAGLDVPSVAVVFTPGPENCGGYQGRYYSDSNTVSVCVAAHASDLVVRTTLLHEMAHAWTHDHLDEAQRDAFTKLRNTPTWDSWDFDWTDRATEHAAVVMAWGLMDVTTTARPVGDTSQGALEQAFQLMTGLDPINDGSVPSPEPTGLGASVVAARLN